MAGFGLQHTGLLPVLALTLVGLLALEQIYRNAEETQKSSLRWLAGGIGTVLAVTIFAYSQAFLLRALTPTLWVTSAVANAAAAPLLLLAIKRRPGWGDTLHVSRQMAIHTTVLTGAGVYLFTMGIVGYLLGGRDGGWGTPVQLLFLAFAGAVFVYAFYSSDVRRWARIFFSKHFFRERYDYRDEWLRLSRALADAEDDATLALRGLRALSAIPGSGGGALWLEDRESGRFALAATVGDNPSQAPPGDDMLNFLRRTQWVVDTQEYHSDPARYSNAFDIHGDWLATPAIVVPLIHGGRVIGVARLDRPALLGSLNFKDHDLLKTAGQQVAVFLVQQLAQEALAETRQFDAYSKLAAFLMHDLKNMISQQELVVGNARRFRDRPEFVDDAIGTMDASVKRMRRLLDRFRGIAAPAQPSRIDLDALVTNVCQECADRQPVPVVEAKSGLYVSMDRDKLAMALTHAIRNAQDATAANGRIAVSAFETGARAVVEVSDTGSGMDEAFVREQLFRPFASTKGARGMGIGAYQMRETVRTAGGDLEVQSVVGKGTTLRFLLPVDARASVRGRESVG
jgi:putative PEP-CTERM system histidine kinase